MIILQTNAKEIRAGILRSTRSQINSALHLSANDIRRDIMRMCDVLLTKSPEYDSLMNGVLSAEFGLTNAEPALRQIVEMIKSSVGVSIVPVANIGNSLNGGIVITMIRSGFEDILSLPEVSYQGKNFVVPWLDWLLTQGDRIIVAGYHITYDLSPAQRRRSQTGIAIMEKGGGWRVPPQFSGTVEENWITRTFDIAKVKGVINDIVQRNILKRL